MDAKAVAAVKQELAAWIDARNIADAIMERMNDNSIPITLDTAKDIWLDCCVGLDDFINDYIPYISKKKERL